MARFIDSIRLKTDHQIYLISGCDFTGRNSWYFLRVAKTGIADFEAMMAKKRPTELNRYGEIVLKGYGILSPEDIKQKLAEC